ncbi:hybrid sensor histidine kinase/response regulator [Salibacter halophilus]|uniref:histidine kinase n=1 Tax=Salibacter halophilus TaxID=1803916 RepID=A0A6N6M8T6_9FLAO|nr:ATP-binding protein [Salibacter halophilus]KAB1065285.1 response regulator [Salibacter halophilus]
MKHKILITEDDAVTALYMKQTAQSLGYEVIKIATEAEEAIELSKNEQPDLVLMDISLPGDIDGIKAADIIIEQNGIPVIYVTGNSDNETMQRAISSNTYGYILKPVRKEQMYTMVEMTLHRHKLEKELIKRENQLKELNEQLEEKVADRTRKLSVNNQRLEQEVERRKAIEEDLKESLAKEKELGELKSRIVTIISHELKTPLTTILSSAQLIDFHADNKAPSEKIQKHTHSIQRNVQALTELVNDTLFISRADAGKIELEKAETNVIEYIEELIDHLKDGLGNGYNFNIKKLNDIPEELMIDTRLLKQILNNLLTNAIKYSPESQDIDIKVGYINSELSIEVKDHGIGIPQKDVKLLFQMFHRASNVENIEGTGIGLAIVKKCLDFMDGQINIDSKVGEGSSFTIYFKAQKPDDE